MTSNLKKQLKKAKYSTLLEITIDLVGEKNLRVDLADFGQFASEAKFHGGGMEYGVFSEECFIGAKWFDNEYSWSLQCGYWDYAKNLAVVFSLNLGQGIETLVVGSMRRFQFGNLYIWTLDGYGKRKNSSSHPTYQKRET